MPKAELQKHTLNLHPGDYAKLQEFYPDLGASFIIRKLVRSYVEQVEAKGVETVPNVDVQI